MWEKLICFVLVLEPRPEGQAAGLEAYPALRDRDEDAVFTPLRRSRRDLWREIFRAAGEPIPAAAALGTPLDHVALGPEGDERASAPYAWVTRTV